MRFVIGAVCTAFLVSGCASSRFFNTNTPADVGEKPKNYEQAVKDDLQRSLKDPFSIQDLNIAEPVLGKCGVGIYGPFHGWRVNVRYNAKNSYGAYVGTKTYYYWFRGEQLRGESKEPGYCPEAAGWAK